MPCDPDIHPKLSALGALDDELWDLPCVAEQLPIFFGNGKKWAGMTVHCFECGQKLDTQRVRGRCSLLIPTTIQIQARGYCEHCLGLTRIWLRIYEDGRVTSRQNGRWTLWVSYVPWPQRWLRAIQQWCKFGK